MFATEPTRELAPFKGAHGLPGPQNIGSAKFHVGGWEGNPTVEVKVRVRNPKRRLTSAEVWHSGVG